MFNTPEEIYNFYKTINLQNRIDSLAKKLKNKKIMLYGAGMFFDVLIDNYDLSKLNIIGVSDIKFNNNDKYKGFNAFAYPDFINQNPDIVLFTLFDSKKALQCFKNDIFPKQPKLKCDEFIKFGLIPLIKLTFFNGK